ncbi:MAG: hypothetical protein NVS3B20_17820 [Polyangiales bacterium]
MEQEYEWLTDLERPFIPFPLKLFNLYRVKRTDARARVQEERLAGFIENSRGRLLQSSETTFAQGLGTFAIAEDAKDAFWKFGHDEVVMREELAHAKAETTRAAREYGNYVLYRRRPSCFVKDEITHALSAHRIKWLVEARDLSACSVGTSNSL